MEVVLEKILESRFNKEDLFDLVNNNEKYFKKLVKISLGDEQPSAWRGAWVLNHSMKKNDTRLKNSVLKIIKSIKNKGDGHQRELIRIIDKMELTDTQEGYLFDVCLTIWEDITKQPGARIFAFRSIFKIVKKYPELIEEIKPFTQKHYYENLSSGIKRSFVKLRNELLKVPLPE